MKRICFPWFLVLSALVPACTGDDVPAVLVDHAKPITTAAPGASAAGGSLSGSAGGSLSGSAGGDGVAAIHTVSSVQLGPGGTINTPYDDGTAPAGFPTQIQLAAVVLLSDGGRNASVTWSSGDTTRATVDASGKVTAAVGAKPGSVAITARSTQDPTKSGFAVVVIRTAGSVPVTVE